MSKTPPSPRSSGSGGDRKLPAGQALRAELRKFDKVIAARPDDFVALTLRSVYLGLANRLYESWLDAEKGARLMPHGHPAELDILGGRAMARREMGLLMEALADLNVVVHLKPAPTLLAARGEVWRRLGDLPKAAADLDLSIQQSANDAFAYVARGRVRLTEGRLDEAKSDFDAAIVLEPDQISARHHRARVLSRQGNLSGARADWEDGLRLARRRLVNDTHDTKAQVWIAWIYAEGLLEKLEEALQIAESIRRQQADFDKRVDYLETLGRVHHRLGHHAQALTLYQQALALCPLDVDLKARFAEVEAAADGSGV